MLVQTQFYYLLDTLIQAFDTVLIVNNESARLNNTIKCRVSAISSTGATVLPYTQAALDTGTFIADGDDY